MKFSREHFKRAHDRHEGPEGGSAPDAIQAATPEVDPVPELKRELTEQEQKELHLLGNDRLRIAKRFVDRRMIDVRRIVNEFVVHESHTFIPVIGDIVIKLQRAVKGVHDSTHEELSKFERTVDAFAALSNALVYACVLAGETKAGAYASIATHALTYGVPASHLAFELAQVGAEKLGNKWTEVVGRLRVAYESMPRIRKAEFINFDEEFDEAVVE